MRYVIPLDSVQLKAICEMQDHLNQQVCQNNFGHRDWKTMMWPLHIALADEGMELIGHLGWKWWKNSSQYKVMVTELNKKQLQLEVIDMLHFGISMGIEEIKSDLGPTMEDMAFEMARLFRKSIDGWKGIDYTGVGADSIRDGIISHCESIIATATDSQRFDWHSWQRLCGYLDMDANDIMEVYLGKYALNTFRADHGYGEGTYQKHWCIPSLCDKAMEDNHWLEVSIGDLRAANCELGSGTIYQQLEYYYSIRSLN